MTETPCWERGADGEGNPNCAYAAGHQGEHSDIADLGDEVPVSRWALRALVRWLTLFAFLFGALCGAVLDMVLR